MLNGSWMKMKYAAPNHGAYMQCAQPITFAMQFASSKMMSAGVIANKNRLS